MNDLDDKPLSQASFSFQEIQGKDKWTAFTPSFGSLTINGATSYNGRYKIVGKQVFFQVQFSAAVTIQSTAGTDYLTLPLTSSPGGLAGMAVMTNKTTNIAVGVCHIDVTNSRCYLPTQAASGNVFTLFGTYEI